MSDECCPDRRAAGEFSLLTVHENYGTDSLFHFLVEDGCFQPNSIDALVTVQSECVFVTTISDSTGRDQHSRRVMGA